MNKLDEIIKNRFENEKSPPIGTFKDRPIKDCMIIYAESYAKKCLEIAKKNIRIISVENKPKNKSFKEDSETETYYTFDEYSLNIDLPEHD